MAKYRTKSVVVGADQFLESKTPWPDGVRFDFRVNGVDYYVVDINDQDGVLSTKRIRDGNWIVAYPDGSEVICDAKTLADDYEPF